MWQSTGFSPRRLTALARKCPFEVSQEASYSPSLTRGRGSSLVCFAGLTLRGFEGPKCTQFHPDPPTRSPYTILFRMPESSVLQLGGFRLFQVEILVPLRSVDYVDPLDLLGLQDCFTSTTAVSRCNLGGLAH